MLQIKVHPLDQGFIDTVRRMSEDQATVGRIAGYFDLEPSQLRNWLNTYDDLKAARAQGLATGQTGLIKAQFKCAVEDRNPQMLIWLGKQYLGQREPEKSIHVTGDMPISLANNWTELAKSARELEKAVETGVPRDESNGAGVVARAGEGEEGPKVPA